MDYRMGACMASVRSRTQATTKRVDIVDRVWLRDGYDERERSTWPQANRT